MQGARWVSVWNGDNGMVARELVQRLAAHRRLASVLLATVVVVALECGSASAVDCIGPDDPPGCVTPAPTPTVTETVTAAPTATPTVTETTTATATATETATTVATVLPSDGVMLAPGQVIGAGLVSSQLAIIVAFLGMGLLLGTASVVLRVKGAHV